MRTRLAATMALLALTLSVPATAQDQELPGVSLTDQCLVNAADEETLSTCNTIVETVLDPDGADPRLVEIVDMEDYMAGVMAVLPDQTAVANGTFQESEPKTKKERRKAKREDDETIAQHAAALQAYLLSVTPDPCYANAYAAGWKVASAMDLWMNRLVKDANQLVLNNIFGLVESGPGTTCHLEPEPASEE